MIGRNDGGVIMFGEMLVRSGLASEEAITSALAKQRIASARSRLGQMLVEQGVITPLSVITTLGEQFHLPIVAEISDDMLDPELVHNLPVEWARRHKLLPIRFQGRLAVVTCDPANVAAQDDLTLLLHHELTPVLAVEQEILSAIERCYFQRKHTAKDFLSKLEPDQSKTIARVSETDDLLKLSESAPVSQLVNLILLDAVKAGASDIHIEPYEKRLIVRYRIDGLLYEHSSPPKTLESPLISRIKVMGRLDIAEKRLPQDGMTKVKVGEREIDIRVSTIPVAEGERVVLRLLNLDSTLRPLCDLGMPNIIHSQLKSLIQEPNGAIWVTGPTGSGKTTTLYAALQEVDTKRRNVLTIEDPIEYQLASIGQMSVKPKIGLTFASGLRHILRQDPDVILIGETRDLETAEIAVRASLTGHLVFSTLHTNSALSAMIRLMDMGIPPYLLSSATKAVLAQRLARRLCNKCLKKVSVVERDAMQLGSKCGMLDKRLVGEPNGCPDCRNGYKGRIGLYEMLVLDDELRDHIRNGTSLGDLKRIAADRGQRTLYDDALDKVLNYQTSLAEVFRTVGRADENI